MSKFQQHMYPGDLVVVRSAAEILETLDNHGTLGGLPFMPEMVAFCGQQFRILRRMEKICVEGYQETFRRFGHNDVVLLEMLRCSGSDHDGCSRACTLLWKEAWLQKVGKHTPPSEVAHSLSNTDSLRARLITKLDTGTYFCQSTQLCVATQPLSRGTRIWVCCREVMVGNRSAMEMMGLLIHFCWRRLRRIIIGQRPRGTLKRTPSGSLNLQPGEWVEVKSFPQILSTLNRNGFNRGMDFSFAMKSFCGKQYRVMARLDRRITEESGVMRELKDTVALEGVECQCYYRFAGCPRADLLYWRELWLKRVNSHVDSSELP